MIPKKLLFLRINDQVYQFIDSVGDGKCLYFSLEDDGNALREFLANCLDPTNQANKQRYDACCMAICVGLYIRFPDKPLKRNELEEYVFAMRRRLLQPTVGVDEWGGTDDLILFSFLSGIPVTVVQDWKSGLSVVSETAVYNREIHEKMAVCNDLEMREAFANSPFSPIPDDYTGPHIFVFHHYAGRPTASYLGDIEPNHYGKLVPVTDERCVNSPIYLGAGKWENPS